MSALHKYERLGLLAINPQAFSVTFRDAPKDPAQLIGDVAIVTVRGPLEQHAGFWCESYEGIRERVATACESTAKHIVIRFDSPGGEVYGMLDTARAIRKRVEAAGKTLTAYVDGEACSAAYALACVASRIVLSQSAFVGSIGVLETRVDASRMDAASGVSYALIASGDRKADRHPHVKLTEAELASAQQRVDSLADVFFDLVAEFRSPTAEALRGLQAELFHGAAAIAAGLADQVTSFEDLLAQLASGGEIPMAAKPGAAKPAAAKPAAARAETPSAEAPKAGEDLDAARAALEKAAEGDGDDAAKAKRALAALDAAEEGDGDDEPADDEDADKGDDEPEAASAPAGAAATSTDSALAATVQSLSAKVAKYEAKQAEDERKALFASRPDLAPELVAALASTPLAKAKKIIDAIKVGKATARGVVVSPSALRGAGQGDNEPVAGERSDELDSAFNGGRGRSAITRLGNKKSFGVMSREDALTAQKPREVAVKGAQ